MSSKVGIANLALNHLGMRPITSLGILTDPAVRAVNTYFDTCRDEVFSELKWPFATVIDLLAEITSARIAVTSEEGGFLSGRFLSTPFLGAGTTDAEREDNIVGSWDYVYAYPPKCSRVWAVFNEGSVTNRFTQEYQVVYLPGRNQRAIATNIYQAYVEYTHKVEDTSIWDPKFTMAFSYLLAANMAPTLIGDAKKSLAIKDIYMAVVSDAKRLAHYESNVKPYRSSAYQASR